MFLNGDFIDCSYDGDDWHWGYEGKYGPACWGSHYDACNGLQQSPIDIPAWQSFFFTQQETNPLKMSGYTAVRFNRYKSIIDFVTFVFFFGEVRLIIFN